MKKRNNKVIILVLTAIIFVVSLGIFILNYSKDDSSFSILEKKWINDNTSKILDVSIYNDVPVFGKKGKGVAFDLLSDFTNKYGINFNKVSYLSSNSSNLKSIAFRIIDNNVDLSDNDILLYEDNYVLVGKNKLSIDRISDIKNINIAVLFSDITFINNYLKDAYNASYTPKESISDIETAISNEEVEYAFIPYNLYLDFILNNDLNILFHLTDISKKYVLTIENKTLLNIMKKYYIKYSGEGQILSYKENFLNEFFMDKEISEVDRLGYNSAPYSVGYTTYMPFQNREDNEFVGTLSNYLSGFEDKYDVDFKMVYYDSIEELKTALSHGEIDVAFGNFNSKNLNSDVIYTSSLFKEEYVILSRDTFVVNSINSLKNKEVNVVKDSYINDLVFANGIKFKAYKDTDDLIRNADKDSIIIVDYDTYNYYKNGKFSEYNILYNGILSNEYTFVIRDVNKNKLFSEMFSYYVSSVNYNEYRYKYNTNANIYEFASLYPVFIAIIILLIIFVLVYFVKRHKNNETIIKSGDKLKYIDSMTSLKNRTYLNAMISKWDENVIYPQAFVVIDLNNIKYINDNHGHEEGDNIIKKAASILIVNQVSNTDIVRTDGNEFLVYMVGYEEKEVISYVRKIYKELKELPYGFGAAIGYSMILDDIKTVDDAINEATLDMRNKKEQVDYNGQN